MPYMNVYFEVVCTCGDGLCRQVEVTEKRGTFIITVEPCKACLEEAYSKGFQDGEKAAAETAER